MVRDLGADPPDLKRVALAVANGDLGVEVLTRAGDKASIMAGLRNMRERLAEVVGTVRQSAESVSAASREISAGNHDLSARTEQQAAALQQTAASMDEMGAAVRQNAESARRADQLAKEAARVAEQGGTVVSNVVNTMKGIHDSSTWARAQAWAMLGLAQALCLGEKTFEADAIQVADWWLAHSPKDGVAFWDFDDPSIPDTNRDTSATAIAAASLIKLAALIPSRAAAYRQAAEAACEQLVAHYLTPVSPTDQRRPGILTAGCFNKRNGVATNNELIWGDYFLLECLLTLSGTLKPAQA